MGYHFIEYFTIVNLFYFFLINSFYVFLILLAYPAIIKRFKELKLEDLEKSLKSSSLPPICVGVPVFNEEKTIVESVHSLLRLKYPQKEIVVVSDGSTDQTMELLTKEFNLVETPLVSPQYIKTKPIRKVFRSLSSPELTVVEKENGMRADTLNCAVNFCSSPLFLQIDADTLVEEDALTRMIRPFLTEEGVIGEGGTIRLLNGCEYKNGKVTKVGMPSNLWEGIQIGEYLRAFLYGRLGWNMIGGTLSISGAFGLFETDAIRKVGGYNPETLAEDLQITLEMIRLQKKRLIRQGATYFVPDPVAWTEGPKNLKTLGNQRDRWHHGLIETVIKYWYMFFNPRYGLAGMIGMPNLVIAETLQPFMEVAGYITIIIAYCLGIVNWYFIAIFFIVSWGISIMLTLLALVMEVITFRRYDFARDVWKLIFFAFMENFGFRQCYLYWKFRALYKYIRGQKGWAAAK